MKVKQVVFKTEADRAKVASGVSLSSVPHEIREVEVEDGQLAPPVVEASAPPVLPAEDQMQEPTTPDTSADAGGIVAFLQEELRGLRHEHAALELKVSQLERDNQQLATVEEQLAPIAVQAIQRLQVGLGQTPTTLKGLPASTLAAHYAEVHALFTKTFPVGVQARSEVDESRTAVDLGEQRLFRVK